MDHFRFRGVIEFSALRRGRKGWGGGEGGRGGGEGGGREGRGGFFVIFCGFFYLIFCFWTVKVIDGDS